MDQLSGCLVITVCCIVRNALALDWLDDPGQNEFEKHTQRTTGWYRDHSYHADN